MSWVCNILFVYVIIYFKTDKLSQNIAVYHQRDVATMTASRGRVFAADVSFKRWWALISDKFCFYRARKICLKERK